MVKALDIIYTPSESVVAQGKDVAKREREGFYKKQGGNGSYRMVKSSKAFLKFEVDGQINTCSVKQLIRDAYSISRVSERNAFQFFNDVASGNIQLEYSDEEGLKLV